ncbi:MAG: hypothetical protein DRG78_24125 [Epsilonproteobacteria bacterium]|nr:MAG: hypothetical protein DRG78_24125 [Campylobacterota bacterium]
MYKFLLPLLLITQLLALDNIKVNDRTGDINLAPKAEVFFDTQSQYEYKDVSAEIFTHNFIPVVSKSVSVGYTSDTIWARFNIINNGLKTFNGKLEIPIPWVNEIDVYMLSDDTLNVKKLGASLAFKEREIDARTFFIPIQISSQKTMSVYLKVQGTNSITLAPHLYSRNSSSERLTYIAMFNGALIGIILIMFLYNLNMYLTLKENNYLFYILYLTGLFFFMGTYYGYNFQLLWKGSPNFNEAISAPIVAFSFFSALLFTVNFLKTSKYFPKSNLVLNILMSLFLVFGLITFMMDNKLSIVYLSAFFITISSIGLVYISVVSVLKKISGSVYLLAAWLFSSVTLLLSSVMVQGYISYSHILYDSFGLGIVLNITLISFALVARTKYDRQRAKLEINQEHEVINELNKSKDDLAEQKARLERKVDIQHVQLREKNKEIQKISIKDELTGLYNTDKLEELLSNELHRAKRYYDNFSIIIINIDNLSKINDKHSFETGNSIIKELSDILIRGIRYIDTVGRLSSTEFLVICPETSSDQAVIASNHLRDKINEYKFFFIGNSVRVSFGVTSALAKDSGQDMITRGYEALSLAKGQGKDRVEVL